MLKDVTFTFPSIETSHVTQSVLTMSISSISIFPPPRFAHISCESVEATDLSTSERNLTSH